MYIGTHISIRGGYLAAAKWALSQGMTAYQFFVKNPRSLQIKQYDKFDASACRQFVNQHRMRSVVHTSYPVNLAAEDEQLRMTTIASLRNDLQICEDCGATGLIVHFGKYKGANQLLGYQLIIRTLNELLADWQGQTMILLENQAGAGTSMGTTFEELTQIRKLSDFPDKIGFCFDTCHAFASGYWNGANSTELLNRGDHLSYWEHLKAVHLNDSVYAAGSGRDRHAPLGEGKIGWHAFQQLMSANVMQEIPIILETPEKNSYTHAQQIKRFQRLIL